MVLVFIMIGIFVSIILTVSGNSMLNYFLARNWCKTTAVIKRIDYKIMGDDQYEYPLISYKFKDKVYESKLIGHQVSGIEGEVIEILVNPRKPDKIVNKNILAGFLKSSFIFSSTLIITCLTCLVYLKKN